MTARIRVLIVDDQALVREGFRKLLEFEPDLEVVDTAGDGEAALATVERLYAQHTPPDVILMDIRMPRLDGIAATRAIKQGWPASHIVILTTFDDTELIYAGLRAGALGYSLKDITAEELAMTVRTAARGQALSHCGDPRRGGSFPSQAWPARDHSVLPVGRRQRLPGARLGTR